MSDTIIKITEQISIQIQDHLFGSDGDCEEAGFMFARTMNDAQTVRLDCYDWLPIPPEGFIARTAWYLELTDEMRSYIIKRAHDQEGTLIEVHSHPTQRRACFSWSDLHGFEEFVPHILWRLPKRPYAAIVMTKESFDGLIWSNTSDPLQIVSLLVGDDERLPATQLTLINWDEINERK